MTIQSEANDVVVTDNGGVARTLCTCPDPTVASIVAMTIEGNPAWQDNVFPSINKLPAR